MQLLPVYVIVKYISIIMYFFDISNQSFTY